MKWSRAFWSSKASCILAREHNANVLRIKLQWSASNAFCNCYGSFTFRQTAGEVLQMRLICWMYSLAEWMSFCHWTVAPQ